jgi:carboxypeptidase Q
LYQQTYNPAILENAWDWRNHRRFVGFKKYSLTEVYMNRCICLLMCVLVLPGFVKGRESGSTSPADELIAAALGQSPIEENLRRLTDEIGGRMSGSPQMRRAVRWAIEAFRQAGVDDVHTEKFSMPVSWSEGDTRLEILAPSPFPVRLASIGWAPPTPPGGIEAEVVDVGEGSEEEFKRASAPVKGRILLVHSRLINSWENMVGEYSRAPGIIDRAVQAGALAILWMASREGGLLYRRQDRVDGLEKLPSAIVAREDAMRIARFHAAGRTVRVRFSLPNRVGGPFEEENVVAEIRGREKPDEIVILGGHLDSWDLGTGALDNGCNSALVIDVARCMRAAGLRPKRTIRFVLFSGEEQGMYGSWSYARMHRAELDRVVCVVIFDHFNGRATGYSLSGRKDIEAPVREVLRPVESWGVTRHTTEVTFDTDDLDFMLEGVPTMVALQEAENLMVNYHASSDTLDKVDIRSLKLNTALAAVTVFGIAERDERLGRRLSRQEIEEAIKGAGMDKEFEGAGLWSMWQQGRRGRQQ